MVHTTIRSPLSATIAVIAAGAVVLSTTTIEPPRPPVALTAPTISTQTVQLTGLAGPLQAADVSSGLASVGETLQGIPSKIAQAVQSVLLAPVAGAAEGAVLGFLAGGVAATYVFGGLPEGFRTVVEPVIPAFALLGAIIGAPIGAVAFPIIAAASWLSGILSQRNAATPAASRAPASAAGVRATTTTPHRTAQPVVQPQRSVAKPLASRASKDAVQQQHSKSTRTRTDHVRGAASKRPAGH
jgi:hypothetical protein